MLADRRRRASARRRAIDESARPMRPLRSCEEGDNAGLKRGDGSLSEPLIVSQVLQFTSVAGAGKKPQAAKVNPNSTACATHQFKTNSNQKPLSKNSGFLGNNPSYSQKYHSEVRMVMDMDVRAFKS
jgi:hypothetical protein